MNYEMISSLVEEYKDEIIEMRRDFHKYPEVAWTEFTSF